MKPFFNAGEFATKFNQLIKEVTFILKRNNWQLVSAESCTGGLLASYLTELPGSSAWFERGFVTYSNVAKHELLSVPKHLIEQFGAVSEPVALAMATGALKNSLGHIAVSVTGIAGPGGGSVAKPVGTVYFAWAAHGLSSSISRRKQFTGSRQEIRLAACQEALSGIYSLIKTLKLKQE